ncbi:MAG TPA: glycosyltransferase family A protein [Lacunisphaera sp.]|jgi:glycosyltransferase involved in cell wall biosynthesis
MIATIPSFSVLIPAYRAGKTIATTLQSVANQTLCPREILIYEDGCFDDLAKTVTKFAESAPCHVRLLSCPLNGGVSRARNILLREAAGEFIAFLDADDVWATDHLSSAAEAFGAGADVAFSGVTFIDGSGREIPGQAEPSAEQLADIAPSMFRYNFVQCTSTLSLRKAWIDRVGNFDVTLSHGEDLDLWLRLLAAGAVWQYTRRCSCTYRKHATSAMGQTLLVVERMAAFYEKHLSNPLIPRATRRGALIDNRRAQARLHWRKRPAAAAAALRRLVRLQPWNPVYLCALPGVMVWSLFSRQPSSAASSVRGH